MAGARVMVLKFSHKLLFLVTLFMALGMGLTTYYAIHQEKKLIRHMMANDIERLGNMAFNSLYTSMRLNGGRDGNREVIERLKESVEGECAKCHGAEENPIAEIRLIHGAPVNAQFGVEEDELPADKFDEEALKGVLVNTTYKEDGKGVARLVMPFFVKEECLRCHRAKVGEVNGAVSIKVSIDDYDKALSKATRNVVLAGAVILVFTLGLSWIFLMRVSIRPITELQKAAKIIGAGNLDHRITIKDGYEINELVKEFNVMAQKLGDRTEEMKLMNKRLIGLSVTDDLTQVFNYRYFYARLNEEVHRSMRSRALFSLVLMDIDNFKKYNDTYGHRQGDMILAKLAGLLKATLRSTDILARYGGEEFAAILPSTEKENAVLMGERLRKAVEEAEFISLDGVPLGRITVSVGVAAFLVDAKDGEELVKKADAACYVAKEKGKNRVERA